MTNKHRKAFVLSVAMAALMLSPIISNAQYREDRYGLQQWGQTSLMGKQGSGGTQGGLDNQDFGGTHGGITNQGFDVPLGSGLLVLVAAGAGYASLKRRDKKTKQTNPSKQQVK